MSILERVKGMGVRVYGRTIVSPFSTKDSPAKCAQINFLVEKCGYTLTDERGFPPKPSEIAEPATAEATP
jgi:hypothetical protein